MERLRQVKEAAEALGPTPYSASRGRGMKGSIWEIWTELSESR